MKKGTIILIGIVVVALIFLVPGCNGYNSLVKKDEQVKELWANVQTQYQRRADLIPNIVNAVRSEATFEQQTLIQTVEARYKNLGGVKIDPNNLTNENFQKFQQAQGEMTSALSRLMVVVENYPTLRSNDAFRGLTAEMAGTENRIQKSREDFNAGVRGFNTSVRSFPMNIFAGMFGFKAKDSFNADAGAERAPVIPENIMEKK